MADYDETPTVDDSSTPDPTEETTSGAGDAPSAYVEEDGADTPDDDGQGGDPLPEGDDAEPGHQAAALPLTREELEQRLGETERRVAEKEQHAAGLTRALQQSRTRERVAMQRFYQVIAKALEANGGVAAADGEQPGAGEPDPSDPVAALQAGVQGIHQRLDERDQREAELEIQGDTQEALDWVRDDHRRVLSEEPELVDACNFVAATVKRSIAARLKFENPGADPLDIQAETNRRFLIDTARIQLLHRQHGVSYARAALETARELGWQGGGQAPARPAARRPTALDRDREARSAPSLSHVPNGSPRKPISKKDYVNMTDEEFADLLENKNLDFERLARALA